MTLVTWTGVIENQITGAIRTPVLQAEWSGKAALSFFESECVGGDGTERVVCIIRGKQDQSVYPSVDNIEVGSNNVLYTKDA
tara:strand:- start:4249 stop:4494 length:246 start_codon:yes stop_codon:yes gene_type:complete